MSDKKKSNRGRKALWDELEMDSKLGLIEDWARNGMIEKDMAESLGVSLDTFYKWKRERPEFYKTLNRGKDVIDALVESTLLKKAMGYVTEEVTQERIYNHETEEYELRETKRVIKEVQPSDTALIFWLKNRRPDTWRDKQQTEHMGEIGFKFVDDVE